MPRKFIPNGDIDFAQMARSFSNTIEQQPGHFGIAPEEVRSLRAAATLYQEKLAVARGGDTRSVIATAEKEAARGQAEKIIRRIAHLLRLNEALTPADRIALGMRERGGEAKTLTVPNEPPRLKFIRAIHEGHAVPMHELSFGASDYRKSRPEGAVRLELFCDLVPPDEPVPTHPGANGVRPFYLRSYTRSPIMLTPPLATVPMRVVYWARWADAQGEVGPFCSTTVGWTEGGSHHLMHGMLSFNGKGGMPKQIEVTQGASRESIERETMVFVALLDAQRRAIEGPGATGERPIVSRELPSPPQPRQRQLEGPITDEKSLEAA